MLLNCGVGEDSWESLDCEEIQPVHPKGNQSWIFTGRTDAEAEAPILWPPDVKNWLIRKDPDAVKDWRQEKGTTEDEMVGWHHRLNGHESEEAPGVGDGQGSLACCSSWGHKESDRIERLNWTEQKWNQPVPLPPRTLWQPPCRYPLTNHFCHSLSTTEISLRASMSCLGTLPDLSILSCVRGYDLHLPAPTFLSLGLSLLDSVHYPLYISVE